jgi:nucleoside-diphosphate-sugar epimerase
MHTTVGDTLGGRVLVTGGTGFIGRHLVAALRARGCEVTVAGLGNARQSPDLTLNLTQRSEVLRVLGAEKFDFAFHCAGTIDQGVRPGIFPEQVDAHITATVNLLDALDAARPKRLVHIGSNAEYGAAPCPQRGDGPAWPNSAYGATKLGATAIVMARARSEDYPAVVVRPFLVYGEGQSPRSFLSAAIAAAERGAEFPTTPGGQTRDFIPVSWVVEDLLRAAEDRSLNGKVVNSCTGHPRRIREVLEKLTELFPGFRLRFGALPYRPTELMDSFGDPITPRSAAEAEQALLKFLASHCSRSRQN